MITLRDGPDQNVCGAVRTIHDICIEPTATQDIGLPTDAARWSLTSPTTGVSNVFSPRYGAQSYRTVA
jgi:hypothetical protein